MPGLPIWWWLLAAVLLLSPNAFAETNAVRRPLPPRRPPIEARTNAVRTVKAVRRMAQAEPARVDVLIAYDRAAVLWATWKGGGITNFAENAVARMNEAVTNSDIQSALVFRLAGVQTVKAQGGTDFDGVLDAVTYGYGEWAAVGLARERFGADVVVTMIDTGSAYGTTGLSWALYSEYYEGFADYAYGVCSVRAVAEMHTMTHEVGHLFGAGHADTQHPSYDPGPLLFPYSSGYYFKTNGIPCRTIMAYDDDGYGNHYQETPYFSNPDVLLANVRIGTASNDNARTLRQTASAVAAFRPEGPTGVDYAVIFADTVDRIDSMFCRRDEVTVLPSPAVRVSPRGTFAGWKCSNGRRYDDGVLVYNLANPGETVTMTAIWE